MAGNQFGSRGPPPPPSMFHSPPDHPQGPYQPRFEQQMPFRPAQAQNTRMINNSTTRISDLTPEIVLTEKLCRRKLTSYEVFTLRKLKPIGLSELRGETRSDSKSSKQSKKSKSNLPKSSWVRVKITQERFAEEDIKKNIRSLDKKRSVTERQGKLTADQADQVARLLEEKIRLELDRAFTWTLAQIQRKAKSSKEIESITLYLKRAPRSDVKAVVVYQNIEHAKMEHTRPPPPPPPPPPPAPPAPQQFPRPAMDMPRSEPRLPQNGKGNMAAGIEIVQHGGGGNMPMGPGSRPRLPLNGRENVAARTEIVQPRSAGKKGGNFGGNPSPEIIPILDEVYENKSPGMGRKKGNNGRNKKEDLTDSSSVTSCSSESGNDSETIDTDTDMDTETNLSSLSSRHERRGGSHYRKEDKERRVHEKAYSVIERPRRRLPTSYVLDPPQQRSRALSEARIALTNIGVSPEDVECFTAAVIAGTRAAIVPQPPPRMISYDTRSTRSHPSSHGSLDDSIIRVRENIRSRDEFRAPNNVSGVRAYDDLDPRNESGVSKGLRTHEYTRKLDLRKLDELRKLEEDLQKLKDLQQLKDLRKLGGLKAVGDETRREFRERTEFSVLDNLDEPRVQDGLRARGDLRGQENPQIIDRRRAQDKFQTQSDHQIRDEARVQDGLRARGDLQGQENPQIIDRQRAQDRLRAQSDHQKRDGPKFRMAFGPGDLQDQENPQIIDHRRAQDELRAQSDHQIRDEPRPGESYRPKDDRPRHAYLARDHSLHSDVNLRHHNQRHEPSSLSRRSGPPPLPRSSQSLHKGSVGGTLPLERDLAYEYARNPFTPLKLKPMYQS